MPSSTGSSGWCLTCKSTANSDRQGLTDWSPATYYNAQHGVGRQKRARHRSMWVKTTAPFAKAQCATQFVAGMGPGLPSEGGCWVAPTTWRGSIGTQEKGSNEVWTHPHDPEQLNN